MEFSAKNPCGKTRINNKLNLHMAPGWNQGQICERRVSEQKRLLEILDGTKTQ